MLTLIASLIQGFFYGDVLFIVQKTILIIKWIKNNFIGDKRLKKNK